jgi:hypothetical protein
MEASKTETTFRYPYYTPTTGVLVEIGPPTWADSAVGTFRNDNGDTEKISLASDVFYNPNTQVLIGRKVIYAVNERKLVYSLKPA